MRIRVENLTKSFGNVIAVDNFSVKFEDGELISLLGPSGCGKSTMLYMLAGIQEATKGHIYFDGVDITDTPPEKRNIGFVFQNYSLYPHMSVFENISFPLEMKKVSKVVRERRVKELAALVQIDDLLKRKPRELSGGQQQRVAIARALAKEPEILLLDEPLSNLDARLRLEMREEIRRIQKETKVTTIFVTHDQEDAMSISDKILLMKSGVKQQFTIPQELYDRPSNKFVAEFIGSPPINQLKGYIHEGKLILEDNSAIITYPFIKKFPEGKEVIMGIRAESIDLADRKKSNLSGRVSELYTMGKEKLAFVNIGTKRIRVYLATDRQIIEGDNVQLVFKDSGIFFFDIESGERLG